MQSKIYILNYAKVCQLIHKIFLKPYFILINMITFYDTSCGYMI